MKIAYFDCFSGISGDMCLGALIITITTTTRIPMSMLMDTAMNTVIAMGSMTSTGNNSRIAMGDVY